MARYRYPEFYEHPVLHQASLMRLLLRAAARRTVSFTDCVRCVEREIRRVDRMTGYEARDRTAKVDISKRVWFTQRRLKAAQLVTELSDHSYRLTCRGRQVLDDNPTGVDDSTLMAFPEFRKGLVEHPVQEAPPPGERSYDAGYQAFGEGRDYTDNPYPADSMGHHAWRDGWFEGRDEKIEHDV